MEPKTVHFDIWKRHDNGLWTMFQDDDGTWTLAEVAKMWIRQFRPGVLRSYKHKNPGVTFDVMRYW